MNSEDLKKFTFYKVVGEAGDTSASSNDNYCSDNSLRYYTNPPAPANHGYRFCPYCGKALNGSSPWYNPNTFWWC